MLNAVLLFTYAPKPHRAAGDPAPEAPAPLQLPASTDGRVLGVDGLLDQISGSVARQFRPEVWPEVQRDVALQRTVGEAIGRGVGRELRPVARLAAGATVTVAALAIVHVVRHWDDENDDR